jgi:hypothetical protein
LLAARVAEVDAALKELDRALQGKVAGFELLDHFFELVERSFEGFGRPRAGVLIRHGAILTGVVRAKPAWN